MPDISVAKVERAYADPNDPNAVASGSVVGTIRYDGLGRRIVKQAGDGVSATRETGDFEMTYHLYHDGQRIVEERNGSNLVIRQYVWGRDYIDELCQVGINNDPTDQAEGNGGQCLCDSFYYALHDVNFNIIGLINSSGALVERYEYTPYGQRTVFFSPGANDSLCMSPVIESQRVIIGGNRQPYGLCDIGHQGLFFDKEFGLYHNRARVLHPGLGRFMQRDPIGYVAGMDLYEYVGSQPITERDAWGLVGECCSSGHYALSDIHFTVSESGFCPLFTATIVKAKVSKVLKEHKTDDYDSCQPGEKCTGGLVLKLPENAELSASLSTGFWWGGIWPFIITGTDKSFWIPFHCQITVQGRAKVDAEARVFGTCRKK